MSSGCCARRHDTSTGARTIRQESSITALNGAAMGIPLGPSRRFDHPGAPKDGSAWSCLPAGGARRVHDGGDRRRDVLNALQYE
ncbi:hypothetical protein DVA67_032360 [Solirubrobacter sp. CPCC 204708]|nr:hypothetical protein [Solirubrobacter deserti]